MGHLRKHGVSGHLLKSEHLLRDFRSSQINYGVGWRKNGEDNDYATALSELQADEWYTDVNQWLYTVSTNNGGGGPVSLYAGCLQIDTSSLNGRTLYKIRMPVAFNTSIGCDSRMTYRTDAETVPDDSWAWTTASPYETVEGTGLITVTLGTPLVLNDTLWLTSWFSDYTPPAGWNDNFFRVDLPMFLLTG